FEQNLVLMFVDVSAFKRAQLSQQRQADFLNGLLQTSSSGIIVYEAIRSQAPGMDEAAGEIVDFKVVFFNAAYERIFGHSTEQIRSQTFRQRMADDSYAGLFELYRQLILTGKPIQYERHFPRQNKWLSVAGTRLQDTFLIIVDDISERKEAEVTQKLQSEQLQQVNHELLRSNEKLQQFSYVASHDLQEPLRKIRQFGEMLSNQYGPVLGDDGISLLTRMQTAATRMSNLIRDLLEYSRLSSQTQNFSPVGLNELVAGVLMSLELVIAEKGAVIEVGELGTVLGDATQLIQVIQNLLTNALKFTRPGQKPHIQISGYGVGIADLPDTFRPVGSHQQYWAIRVSDDGIGFQPNQAERIFGAFERIHGNGHYAGSGIGLAIVKRVAENHGGYIMAESQPEQGATFTLYLPA
ncbi:MAG: hypothetical protein JWP57_613, partial [Spirosoma sp.]|nr:hypothetical protein [Spirosoma sp.]